MSEAGRTWRVVSDEHPFARSVYRPDGERIESWDELAEALNALEQALVAEAPRVIANGLRENERILKAGRTWRAGPDDERCKELSPAEWPGKQQRCGLELGHPYKHWSGVGMGSGYLWGDEEPSEEERINDLEVALATEKARADEWESLYIEAMNRCHEWRIRAEQAEAQLATAREALEEIKSNIHNYGIWGLHGVAAVALDATLTSARSAGSRASPDGAGEVTA